MDRSSCVLIAHLSGRFRGRSWFRRRPRRRCWSWRRLCCRRCFDIGSRRRSWRISGLIATGTSGQEGKHKGQEQDAEEHGSRTSRETGLERKTLADQWQPPVGAPRLQPGLSPESTVTRSRRSCTTTAIPRERPPTKQRSPHHETPEYGPRLLGLKGPIDPICTCDHHQREGHLDPDVWTTNLEINRRPSCPKPAPGVSLTPT